MSYNTDFIVHYTNNTEYRKQFRALFNMIAQNQDDDIDEETLDEQNYDNKTFPRFIGWNDLKDFTFISF